MHEMRRTDKQLTKEEAFDILKNGEYGVLSTVDVNGNAYGVPISYAVNNNNIYVHCADGVGYKIENIRKNNKVSFCVVGKTKILPSKFSTEYESAIVFGNAQEVNGEEKTVALISLLEKYSPDHIEKGKKYIAKSAEETGVIKISIEQITGKAGR